MSNIYNISVWYPSTHYLVNDIVQNGSFFYYCITEHISGSLFDGIGPNWNGLGTDFNGETKPLFFWKPSYNSSVKQTPRIKSIVFGNGYEQRTPDGINNNLLNISIQFDLRTTAETTAIIHFLNTRQGTESFLFTPSSPYAQLKRFTCKEWDENYLFFNNHSIKAIFEEKPY